MGERAGVQRCRGAKSRRGMEKCKARLGGCRKPGWVYKHALLRTDYGGWLSSNSEYTPRLLLEVSVLLGLMSTVQFLPATTLLYHLAFFFRLHCIPLPPRPSEASPIIRGCAVVSAGCLFDPGNTTREQGLYIASNIVSLWNERNPHPNVSRRVLECHARCDGIKNRCVGNRVRCHPTPPHGVMSHMLCPVPPAFVVVCHPADGFCFLTLNQEIATILDPERPYTSKPLQLPLTPPTARSLCLDPWTWTLFIAVRSPLIHRELIFPP
jgi:hypothetical protein